MSHSFLPVYPQSNGNSSPETWARACMESQYWAEAQRELARKRHQRRRWLIRLAALGVLLLMAAIVVAVLALTHKL